MHIQYTPQEMQLAKKIAETLSDNHSMLFHLQTVRKYKESFLRKCLAATMAVHDEDVRKSRGAIYTAVIIKNATYGDTRD